jgi:hypothetical protein
VVGLGEVAQLVDQRRLAGVQADQPFFTCGWIDSMRSSLSLIGCTPRAGTGMPRAAARLTSSL